MDQAENLRQLVDQQIPLRVIAVTSGKGGVGKSNITANIALLAAKTGRRVLVIDADLGLANVEILFGLTPRFHIGQLIEGTATLEQVLAKGPAGISVLPAGNGLQGLTHLDDAEKVRLVAALEQLEDKFDFVLVDTGAGIGDNVLFFVGAAQEALLVVNQEPTALSDAYASIKVLSQQAGVTRFNVIVNSIPDDARARAIFDKLTGIADRFLDVNVKYIGHVPRDENVHRAVMARSPVTASYPHSPASRALQAAAGRLLAESGTAQLQGGLKFLWQRMLREDRWARGA